MRTLLFSCLVLTFFSHVDARDSEKELQDSVVINQKSGQNPVVISDGHTGHSLLEQCRSVSLAEPALINSIPSWNLSNVLQGRISGVSVAGNGQPSDISKVRIRGFSSFLNNDPLYIVDGIPSQEINFLNPRDVESVYVLKDAAAASVYGSRASNGVVIINTIKGEKGFSVGYNMSAGMQLPGKGTRDEVLNTQEYADLQWLVYKNDGWVEIHPTYGSSFLPDPVIPDWAANTDWYDEMTDPALTMDHYLNISGGTEKASFYAGFGAFKQDGIIKYTDNSRYSARLNSDFSFLKGRLKAGERLSFSLRDYMSVPNLSEASPVQQGPYRSQSIIPVIWTGPDFTGPGRTFRAGDWGGTGIGYRLGNAPNVVAELTRNKDDYVKNTGLSGSLFADLTITEGLSVRSTLGGIRNYSRSNDYTYPAYEMFSGSDETSIRENTIARSSWVWTSTLTFSRQYGKHGIKVVAGYESSGYDIGRFTEKFRMDINVAPYIVTVSDSGSLTKTRVLSSFIMADYSFDSKYLLGVSLRRDGCSRFSTDTRYGLFPALSAGWVLTSESFMENASWLSLLKIRASWGITGNQFALSPSAASWIFEQSVGAAGYDLYGTFNSAVAGYYPVRIANPDAKWEESKMTNVGFDAMFFDNRLNLTFDWYSKSSYDILYNPPQPATSGSGESPFINTASMKNNGIDIELDYNENLGNLGFSSTLVVTAYHNTITGIDENVKYFTSGSSYIGPIVSNQPGHSLSEFYGYKVTGLFQNDGEISRAPLQSGAAPGFFRYQDTDNSGDIDNEDRIPIGNTHPKFTLGLNLGLNFKQFDLTAFFFGSQGNDIFNYNKWFLDFWPSWQGQKSRKMLYESWTPLRTDTNIPKASNQSNFSTNGVVNSYYIEDGSYLRMKNIQLGYSLPPGVLNKLKINSLRFYIQGLNLFTITKYSGLDPEIGGDDLASGIDSGNYPSVRQLIFGLNVSL